MVWQRSIRVTSENGLRNRPAPNPERSGARRVKLREPFEYFVDRSLGREVVVLRRFDVTVAASLGVVGP